MRRPPRLLTPLGRGVVVVGLLAGALGARLHWQEFTLLALVALLLLGVALLFQLPSDAPGAWLDARQPRLVVGGPPAEVTLHVRAGTLPRMYPQVDVPGGSRTARLRLPFLAPHAEHTVEVELGGLPRGVHVVGPVTWDRTDPVGLMSRTVEVGGRLTLLVAPRVVDVPLYAGGLTNDLDGATSSQVSMSDLAFHALREYVQGDDLRHVHWRSSAKAGELLVRQYHETRRGQVTVLVDDSRAAYADPDDFELAVSVAASIALRAAHDDLDTYLRCGSHVVRGRDSNAIIDTTCRFGLRSGDGSADIGDAARAVPATGLLVQVTGGRRSSVDLDRATHGFATGTDRVVVRADATTSAAAGGTSALRELFVPDLAKLPELLARSLR